MTRRAPRTRAGLAMLVFVAALPAAGAAYDYVICNNGHVCDMANPGESVSSCFYLVNQEGIACSGCCAQVVSKRRWTAADGCGEAPGACSGYHEHGASSAPLPSVTGACADAAGHVCVQYGAPPQAGMTVVRWRYYDPSGQVGLDTQEDVMLWTKVGAPSTSQPFSALGYDASLYSLVGGEATHAAGGDVQTGNHWGTGQTVGSTSALARTWQSGPQPSGVTTCPPRPKLQINDMSLGYGGLYDFNETWSPPHSAHRDGRNVDVASIRSGNGAGVPTTMEHDFCLIALSKGFASACLHGGGAPAPCTSSCGPAVPHFHLTR